MDDVATENSPGLGSGPSDHQSWKYGGPAKFLVVRMWLTVKICLSNQTQLTEFTFSCKAFVPSLQYITFTEKDMNA